MAKKRQHDFTKVQLRPGRPIGKRGNLTSVKFKSRKITMPKEKIIRIKSEVTIADYAKRVKVAVSEKDKCELLVEMNKLIQKKPDSLNPYLRHIFNGVLLFMKDPLDNLRNTALKVIISVLELTDDLQLHSFSHVICKTIVMLMKSPIQRIVPVSLILLDSMLKHHPKLICHDLEILDNLLPTERKHYTRKIINEREKYKYSENDEINALAHISAFLENMLLLKNKNDSAKNEEEDKVVYMDKKRTMSVVLYAGGGLQTIDIEEAYASQFNPQMDPFDEVEKLTPCINMLLKYIPNYFCQIIGRESNADDNAFKSDPISDLSILIQLLCHVAELAEKLAYANAAEEIAAFLKEKVFSSHKKRFPFELHSVMSDTSPLPLALLNASLCYLHMKFLSSDDSYDDDGELIKRYLRKFFSIEKTFSSEMRCKCIPYFIKMIQLCEYKTDVPEVIPFLLKYLVLLLKTTRINHPNKKILMKFLLDMTLLPGYKFWIDIPAVKLWYDWLIGHLKDNKIDKTIIKMICKTAKLRHPSFIERLDINVLKFMLKKGNDDLKETAIFLLHNMDIDNDLLRNVYDVICMDSFSTKLVITLIHMLNVRFNQYPANKRPYVDYIEFLLNIAIDVSNFSKIRMTDLDADDYTRAVQRIQNGHPFCIVPSLHWKEHSKVFEVCLMYLRNLPMAPVSVMFMRVVKELLRSSTLIPIHCALAILKLDMPELNEKHHRLLMRNLNFSCLLTTSVLTQTKMDEEWYKWTVCELMNSMSLSTNLAIRILELLEQGNFGRDPPDGLLVYHILRVLKVFVERNLLDYECADVLELILQVIHSLVDDQCTDKTIKVQPLFSQMYSFFIKYFCE